MFKPSSRIKDLAQKTREKIEASENLDLYIGKVTKKFKERIDVYIDDTLDELKALGLKFTKSEMSNNEITKFDITFSGVKDFENAVLLFNHSETNQIAILSLFMGSFANSFVDKNTSIFYDSTEFKTSNAISSLETLTRISGAFVDSYKKVDQEYNAFSKDIKEIVVDYNKEVHELRSASTDPIVVRMDLMEENAIEVYEQIKKKKSFTFSPKKENELLKIIKKNKNFFFAMDGQSNTLGERSRYNMYGDSDRAYKQILADILNTEDIFATSFKNLLLPFLVEKGGLYAFPVEGITVKGSGKNFKLTVTPSKSDKVLNDGVTTISPRKEVSIFANNDEKVDNVFIMKGWLMCILALWTDEINEYMSLYK